MSARLLSAALLGALLLAAAPARAQGHRRFALVVGNNTGGDGTRPLAYATEDARKLHGLLTRVGGVAREDATLLLDAPALDVLAALGRLEAAAARARAGGERTALFVYYSGHAKDGALRLGETRLGFDALKRRLSEAPADVRIAVFDACRSGALARGADRAKGARKAPAFEVDAGAARAAQGLVILTSSASDEDSQESDDLGGSYFSHHLTSGLLGDADGSGDGQVTLFEAYSYAYERTVADTAGSTAGAQHPTFSFDLAGNGDFVVTRLTERTEGVAVPEAAPAGPYYFVDRRGFIVAEVAKADGQARRVALAPGTYRVKRRLEDRLRVGEVSVRRGEVATLDERSLRDTPFSDDPVKGGRGPTPGWAFALAGGYQSFFDAGAQDALFAPVPLVGLEAALHDSLRPGWTWGLDVAAGAARGRTLELPALRGTRYDYSALTFGTSLAVEWRLTEALTPYAGGRLGYLLLGRRFPDAELPDQHYAVLTPGLVAGLRLRLTDSLHLGARGRVHYLVYDVDARRNLGYWEAAALFAYKP